MKDNVTKFRSYVYNRHDVDCNQKYDGIYPYSMHLGFVESQGNKFMHLLPNELIVNKDNHRSIGRTVREIVRYALISHDTLEDARMTYNDLFDLVNSEKFANYKAAKMIADIVYCVTDEKGKTRKERKNYKFYNELKQNDLAVFVKLADLAANTLYSKLSGSDMYDKYKKEWPAFKDALYLEKYDEFFTYIENI